MAALPEITVNYQELPRTVGDSFLYTKVGARKFTLDFMLVPEKVSDMDYCASAFGQWLSGDNFKPSKLVFSDRPSLYLLAQVDSGVKLNDLFYYGETSVSFIATDPLFYSEYEPVIDVTTPVNMNYSGDKEQPFKIVATLPKDCTRVTLKSSRNDHYIQLDAAFKKGAVITVDTSKKQVLLDNQLNMKVLSLDSEWFNLASGFNEISILLDNAVVNVPAVITHKVASL